MRNNIEVQTKQHLCHQIATISIGIWYIRLMCEKNTTRNK